jgi:hypothetical protein
MITHNTPCIGPIADELYHIERSWSLVDEITDEVEMIRILEIDHTTETYEFIIAAMDITDEESSRNHRVYFFGNHGTKTLVFFLYSSQFGLPAYLASWSGTPETNSRRIVIVTHDTSP